MDIEDANALFDAERVSRELAVKFAQQLQLAVEAYTNNGRPNQDKDHPDIALVALQGAVAELMAQHNRTLWHAVQQLFDKEAGDYGQ